MRRRSPVLALVRGQRGVGATEYVILFILAGLGALLLYGKYGRTVGGKVQGAGSRVETLGEDQGGHIVERPAPSTSAGAASGSGDGGGGSSGSRGIGPGAGSGSGAESGGYANTQLLPDRIDGGEKARSKKLDTRIAVILGIIVLAIGALMILAVARGARKEEKKVRKQ
jgi:hypothetical protein